MVSSLTDVVLCRVDVVCVPDEHSMWVKRYCRIQKLVGLKERIYLCKSLIDFLFVLKLYLVDQLIDSIIIL